MHRLFRVANLRLAVAVVLAFPACKVDANARVLTLRTAVAPSTDCGFLPSNQSVTSGYYDPWVNNGQGAVFAFTIDNFAGAATDELVASATAGFVPNSETHRHDAQIEAVEGCWFVANAPGAPKSEVREDGRVVDCVSLPAAQSRLSMLGVTADEGSSPGTAKTVAVSVRLFDMVDLQALFGPTFNPRAIPVQGASITDDASLNPGLATGKPDGAAALAYSYTPALPSDLVNRSAAWGDKFPPDNQARVLLQLRVRAKMLSGGTRHSNWMVHPITVCPGCLRDVCGPLVQKTCARGPCTDGSPCLADGTCSAGAPVVCTPVQLFSGSLPSFSQPTTCLPAQAYPGGSRAECVNVGCDAN